MQLSLDLLDTPVRVTWDISKEESHQSGQSLLKIAEKITEAGVFVVTLQGEPLQAVSLPAILDSLSGCQLQLICNGNADELDALSRLPNGSFQVVLDVTSDLLAAGQVDEKFILEAIKRVREYGYDPVLALTPLRKTLGLIPDLLAFCSLNDIAKLKLPNAHIGDSFHGYSAGELPRWEDLSDFSVLWRQACETSGSLPTLEIHDLFLWEIMTPGEQQNRSEYGGCQAGNSLAHIDIKGNVHPCAAWPHSLGNLLDLSLESIWAGEERRAICEKIANTPAGCDGCRDLGVCFGGCRGLALHLNREAGERDLMCSGPR